MIAARHSTLCPGCEARIEPGDMIDRIALDYYCEACVREWQAENDGQMGPECEICESLGGPVLVLADCTTFGPDCACNGPMVWRQCPCGRPDEQCEGKPENGST